MDVAAMQRKIDELVWYHDFDFGGGLTATARAADKFRHRPLWEFMKAQLDAVDFRGKSVLDVGCWDGYWSFYAEKRGAARVLATDDQSQNYLGSQGLHVARELLNSRIEVDLDASVYHFDKFAGQTFDVILFLGVYYHLLDPFHALAQLRHLCHENTVVLIDGPISVAMPGGAGLFRLAHHDCEFLPTLDALRQLMSAAYFTETGVAVYTDEQDARERAEGLVVPPLPPESGRVGWRWRLDACLTLLRGERSAIRDKISQAFALDRERPRPTLAPEAHARVFMKCKPFVGANPLHAYPPPFGLARYDERFR